MKPPAPRRRIVKLRPPAVSDLIATAVAQTALIRTVHPLDGAAAAIAKADGCDWADIPEASRNLYRDVAATAILAAGES